jgi:hypothetical protein
MILIEFLSDARGVDMVFRRGSAAEFFGGGKIAAREK